MEPNHSKVFLFVAAGLCFLVIAGVVLGSVWTQPWKSIKVESTNQPYARTITVSADGKVNAAPDIAIIELSVVTQGKTVKQVLNDGNKKMTAVVDAVKKQDVNKEDIMTSQYSLNPEYIYPDRMTPQISGYRLYQSITVKVRDIKNVEDVLDAGLAAGSNQVGQLRFDIDDTSKVKKEAREIAFAKAKGKAKEMADAAGVKLGKVVTFSEGYDYYQPPMYNYKTSIGLGGAAESYDSATIEPGSKEMTMTVSVTYEIE